jgi:cytochrome P450
VTTTTADVPYLDLSDPEFSVDSEEVTRARERSWYARTNYGLAVLRYEQVSELLKDRRLRQGSWAWPALNGVETGPLVDWWNGTLLNLEGEDHKRLRKLLNPAFTPGLVNGLAPRFRELAGELIDAFESRGRCEFVTEFAEPYATRVIAIMLGIPEDEWRRLAQLSGDLGLFLGVTIKNDLDKIESALKGLYGYADELIAERADAPREDFVSTLIQAQVDEDRLTHQELRISIVLLIFGGVDTTRNQLGLAMDTFMRHPDQWRLLAEQPDLGPNAVEEVMRVAPTVTWVTREALEDFDYQGLEVRKGTTIHLLSSQAGTDPRKYGEDVRFDITASDRPRHFGFGGGWHHCIGHFVARGDMSEALPMLARRMPDPRLDGEARWLPRSGNTGPLSLPIAFGPR